MKVDIIEIYGDQNCCMGAIHVYMFLDGELVLAGDKYKNIEDMIHGAQAMLHFQNKTFQSNRHRVSDPAIYYRYQNEPEKIYSEVVEDDNNEEETSAYGSF